MLMSAWNGRLAPRILDDNSPVDHASVIHDIKHF